MIEGGRGQSQKFTKTLPEGLFFSQKTRFHNCSGPKVKKNQLLSLGWASLNTHTQKLLINVDVIN
jgi:hypothetical protein